jgi:dTMP kinase
MKERGRLITFEGGDGAGKSTLIHSLHDHLEKTGSLVIKTRAPGGTTLGETIRSLLLTKGDVPLNDRAELFLFLADRAQHVEEVIKPALSSGMIVLCDRYNDSTVAYQGVARGLDPVWSRSLCDFATGAVQPSLTLYLDIDPEIGLRRAQHTGNKQDRIESEGLLFHKKIRNAFHMIAGQEPSRFKVIDATQSPDDVFRQAVEMITHVL